MLRNYGAPIGVAPVNGKCGANVADCSFSQLDLVRPHPTATTMTAFYTLIITRLIAWLHGLSRADFDFALNAVRSLAMRTDIDGSEKAKIVGRMILRWLSDNGREMGTAAVNVLIELAVSYARKVK
jgi:hypothetical protein